MGFSYLIILHTKFPWIGEGGRDFKDLVHLLIVYRLSMYVIEISENLIQLTHFEGTGVGIDYRQS